MDGYFSADFLILPETHRYSDQKLEIDNFTVYQKNRKKMAGSRRGSGGIAIAINNSLLINHEIISIYENSFDGQIGLKLKNTSNEFTVCIIALYLSPDSYHYGQDAEGFFNNAAVMWQDCLDCDLLIGAGDINARTKELPDYIPEIDGNLIPKRYNPDKIKNAHGSCFLTFLKKIDQLF